MQPECHMCCWQNLAGVVSCWQARYCLLFKAAVAGSSCDHTGSASTTCLPQNGDYYYRGFSLTFSKIEMESLVCSQRIIKNTLETDAHQDWNLKDQTFSTPQHRTEEPKSISDRGLLSQTWQGCIYKMGFMECGPMCWECFWHHQL